MDTPFKVIFHEKTGGYGTPAYRQIDATSYFQEDVFFEDLKESNMISITENKDILMDFDAGGVGARLYMDTLDYYQSSICEEDEKGNIFISESNERITLFQNAYDLEHNISHYPFVPGSYRIHVRIENKVYYAYLNVEPKQLSKQDLNDLRAEVEEMIENLAHDLIKHESASLDKSNPDNDVSVANQILRLMQDSGKLMGLIEEIKNSPRSKIAKIYHMEEPSKVRIIDQETIRHRLKHPDTQERMYVPKRLITHDLPENQVIIRAVQFFLKIGKNAIDYLSSIIPYVEKGRESMLAPDRGNYHYYQGRDQNDNIVIRQTLQLDELIFQLKTMKKIVNSCTLFLKSDWVKEVLVHTSNTPSLYLDVRYRNLFQLYHELKNLKKQIKLDSNYAFFWKRTDLIYEMWGFIRLIKALQTKTIGFVPVQGWIYGNSELRENWIVPFLEEGTIIKFVHTDKNQLLNLVYDKPIPKYKKQTTYYNPLYTEFPHNRPDARIDVYVDDMYKASFVIDFKYRPAQAIGSVSSYDNDHKVYQQLLHYKKFDSPFVNQKFDFKVTEKRSSLMWEPVQQVWVMYPNFQEETSGRVKVDDWLTRIPYSPREDLSKLEKVISDALSIFD